jgi:hypothetical protein
MEKMFVHVAKKSTFTSELQEQYTNSIVFIKDSQEIYTHGTFYAIPDSYKGKITSLESAVAALQAAKAFSKVSDGTNVAESPSHDGTLKFNKGSNVNITVGTDGVTISATDTKYTQGSGISIEGTTINHSNSVTAGTAKGDNSKTLAFGGTFTIPSITYDAQGHVTAKGTTTMTMPAAPSFTNWQAKNVVGASATATANAATTNATTFLNLIENGAVRSSHQITGTGKVTVTADATGKVTINGAATTAASGSANGTIAIDGTDVAVKGLGSAAYTASSAYATAAQGTKADNAVPNTRTVNGHALSAIIVSFVIFVNGQESNTTLPTTVTLGNTTYTYKAAYLQGPQPKDNKGNNYSTPLAAGSVNSSAITLNGTYPWYASTSTASSGTPVVKQALIAWNTSTGAMTTPRFELQPSGTLPQVFKLPRAVTQLQMLNTVSGNMEVIGLSDWTKTEEEITVGTTPVTYSVYTYNGSTRGSVTLIAKF